MKVNFSAALIACAGLCVLLTAPSVCGSANSDAAQRSDSPALEVPDRPTGSLFKGESGVQQTQVFFDPATHGVTLKVWVEDPQGFFIPNIRRDNFAVYEDGVRQKDLKVEVEHLPISMAVLAEYGGRYQSLNEASADAVTQIAAQFLDEIAEHDDVALWTYDDRLNEVSGFTHDREALRKALSGLPRPRFSELNFYDAFIASLERIRQVQGRRALLVISSGIDTFSSTHFTQALAAARASAIPVYVIDIGPALRSQRLSQSATGNYSEARWERGRHELERLAKASGGRLYAPESVYESAPIYDDILEHLRMRYLIRYISSSAADPVRPRTLRIELIDAQSGRPLEIVDADGKRIRWSVTVHHQYVPDTTPMADAASLTIRRGVFGLTSDHALM